MLKDFKAFITRGSVIDMTMGIIIGAAFSPIVSSFVNDVLMPPIGLALIGRILTECRSILLTLVLMTVLIMPAGT